MPITQPRLASLLLAAEDFRAALFRATSLAKDALTQSRTGADPALTLANLALDLSAANLLADPMQSEATLAEERVRLRLTSRINERNKAHKTRQRRAAGVAPARLRGITEPPALTPSAPWLGPQGTPADYSSIDAEVARALANGPKAAPQSEPLPLLDGDIQDD